MRDYNRDLIKQIDELTLENEGLHQENKRLRTENREFRAETVRLRDRLEKLEGLLEDRISESVEEAVSKAVAPLQIIIAEKEKEILRLKSQIDKYSSNSSKPSSSNGFKKIPNNREKSGKSQGGQPGHKGSRFNIPINLDELVAAGKAEHVIVSEVSDGEPYTSDWVVDIKVVTVFTEYRRKPGKPPKIEYGVQLKVIAVYLSVIGLIAYKRLSQFFHELSHNTITVSKAMLAEFNCDASDEIDLSPHVQDLLNGKVISVDETPIKTTERPGSSGELETSEKTTFSVYIRTYSNSRTTVLTANPFKTEVSVVTDNILTQFHGIVSQDHESKFYNFGYSNATCGAHLTRELKGMAELQLLGWAADVRRFFLEMNDHKNEDVLNNKTACEPVLLCSFEACYDDLLAAGKLQLAAMLPKSFGWDELRRMINRLEKHKDHYLLFIRDYEAPFTNNQAERDLRHCKTR